MASGGYSRSNGDVWVYGGDGSTWTQVGQITPQVITASFSPGGSPVSTPTKTPQDFAGLDYDLAVGEIYGLRVWMVDRYGRLRARHKTTSKPWRPGVNIAQCLAGPRDNTRVVDPTGKNRKAIEVVINQTVGQPSEYRITWSDGTKEVTTQIRIVDDGKPHAVPDESCQCGFYAYTDPWRDETRLPEPGPNSSLYALGVIKGYGRTLVGTQGFRCEKAEIVALRELPYQRPSEWRDAMTAKIQKAYPDVPLLPSRTALLEFAPIESTLPDPSTDEFWELA